MPKPKGKKKPARQDAKGKTQEVDEVIPSNKIYVGNLSGLDITDEKLQKLFESCGDIRSANLVNTSNHAFGFVEFATVDEAERAIVELSGHSGLVVKFARSTSSAVCFKTSEQATEDSDGEEEEAVLAPNAAQDVSAEQDDHETCTALLDLATARAAAARAYPSPIESLDSLMQKATRATSTRDCIAYSFEEEDFGYVASVELLLPNGRHSCHSGESRDSKKDAKKSAALVALRDPEVHRLLPPLPSKLRESDPAKSAYVKAAKELPASDAELESQEEEEATLGESRVEENIGAISAKDQRKHEKAELRAKKLARRKAAKAFKAALAEVEDEEETSDSSVTDIAEESEDEEDEETATDDDDDEDARLDPAELVAKKAAIKAALAAKRRAAKGSRQTAANDDAKKKATSDSKKKTVNVHEPDFKMSDKVKDGKMQANFGQTKFIKP